MIGSFLLNCRWRWVAPLIHFSLLILEDRGVHGASWPCCTMHICTWRNQENLTRLVFFDHSGVFNTVQPHLIGQKLQKFGFTKLSMSTFVPPSILTLTHPALQLFTFPTFPTNSMFFLPTFLLLQPMGSFRLFKHLFIPVYLLWFCTILTRNEVLWQEK